MSKSLTTTGAAAKGVAPMGLAQMRRAPTHPGAILAEVLSEAGLSSAEAARRISVSKAQLSHVQTGRKPMPHSMCVKLAALLGTSAEFWATLQMRHDLWHAMHATATKKAVKAIIAACDTAIAFRPGEIDVPTL